MVLLAELWVQGSPLCSGWAGLKAQLGEASRTIKTSIPGTPQLPSSRSWATGGAWSASRSWPRLQLGKAVLPELGAWQRGPHMALKEAETLSSLAGAHDMCFCCRLSRPEIHPAGCFGDQVPSAEQGVPRGARGGQPCGAQAALQEGAA